VLIAEDLLLLITDDDTGRLVASSSEVDVALGGAMLVELADLGRVGVAEPGGRVRKGRVEVLDRTPTGDPMLDGALATAVAKEGKRPQDVVTALGKKQREAVYGRLVEAGILRAERGKVLGVFPLKRWPAEDAAHEEQVRAAVVTALRNGLAGDARTAALVSLLLALKAVHKAVPPSATGLSKREQNANAKRIAQGDWASAAVRKAIDSTNAAIAATAGGGAVAGSS
jgi:hypothetical protein